MIEIADTNDHLKTLGSIIFKRKYSKETFYINCAFQAMGGFDYFADLYIKPEFVEILSLKIAKKFFNNFGHLISNLIVDYRKCRNDDEKRILFDLINANCANTLKELKLFVKSPSTERFFDQFTNAFRSVEVLHLRGIYGSLDSSNSTFSELFPSLRTLCVEEFLCANKSFVEHNLPHLSRVHFDMSLFSNSDSFNELAAERFFRNNRQIQELKLKLSNQRLLQCVADGLQQIDSLILEEHFEENDISNDTIRFDSVRKFAWINADFMVPHRLIFTNLIEFESDGGKQKCSNCLDFFRNSNDTLTKLHLNGRFIEDEELNDLCEINRNLAEFKGKLKIDVDPETIIRFVERCENLRKVQFEFSKDDSNYEAYNEIQKILRERLPKYWRINTNQRKLAISLRR